MIIVFSERLKFVLEERQIKQLHLAKYLNVTQQAVNRWCQNITTPDYETLSKIAQYLHVSIDYLLGNDENFKKQDKELEEKQALKNALINAGYMKDGEDLTKDELERLMEFVKNNKNFIRGIK